MEEYWLEQARDPILQGMLQVAVALYHAENGNRSGAEKLFIGALDKLQHAPDVFEGINLIDLRERTQERLNDVLRMDNVRELKAFPLLIADAALEAAAKHYVHQKNGS